MTSCSRLHLGFSLVETLIALILMSSVALLVVQYQWKAKRLQNDWLLYDLASNYLENVSETIRAHAILKQKPPSFLQVKRLKSGSNTRLVLMWQSLQLNVEQLTRDVQS